MESFPKLCFDVVLVESRFALAAEETVLAGWILLSIWLLMLMLMLILLGVTVTVTVTADKWRRTLQSEEDTLYCLLQLVVVCYWLLLSVHVHVRIGECSKWGEKLHDGCLLSIVVVLCSDTCHILSYPILSYHIVAGGMHCYCTVKRCVDFRLLDFFCREDFFSVVCRCGQWLCASTVSGTIVVPTVTAVTVAP